MLMEKSSRIFVAGHRGLVGSAILRRLTSLGFKNIVTKSRDELDLSNSAAVSEFFNREKPEYVFLAAARVGGILANSEFPAEFLRDNLSIELNVIHTAHLSGVRKLLFLGSSCIYPKHAPQPMREDALLTGPLEPTNEAYAIAKIAGIRMCQAYNRQYGTNFVSVMPTNLYGPGDNFDLQTSHVVPALLRKFHEAKVRGDPKVVLWGTGRPRREFLHVDDLAEACVFVMLHHDGSEILNIGCGVDVTISELAQLIKEVTAYAGGTAFDTTKADGTPQKLLDVSRLTALGWTAKIPLREGIAATYNWFCQEQPSQMDAAT